MEKRKKIKKRGIIGGTLLIIFIIWTLLIQVIDVEPLGQNGTNIGFASFNIWFHQLTGVDMLTYLITDWLAIVPLLIATVFGAIGFAQLIKRKSLFKVDYDIIILGVYYILVVFLYIIFEMIPINYRPILIDGVMESSYPSSTTLLVLSVMPTLVEQANRRISDTVFKRCIIVFVIIFSTYMVLGRLISGVHWFTDIVGSVFLSLGLFFIYKTVLILFSKDY